MNILFILGNGFDINLGLGTRYCDFYKHYEKVESSSNLISQLKKDISENVTNWSDLELALGKYTKKLNSTEEFNEVFEDIGDRLAEYLSQIESEYDFSKIDQKKLFEHLIFPERSLNPADENSLSVYKGKMKSQAWFMNVITLNYTQSFEKIVGITNTRIKLGDIDSATPLYLNPVYHIHGFHDNRMVLGVNDITQIANGTFHSNRTVLNAFVKSECNRVMKHTIDMQCKRLVHNADIIYIFGSSLGDTDKLWWDIIAKRLLNSECRLVIFEKGIPVSPRRLYLKSELEDELKTIFLSKTTLTTEQIVKVLSQIYVGYDTTMFMLT